MGIRFFCPQGHRLNVKSHLAGKRGFCPECGVRVEIPHQSDRQAVAASKRAKRKGAERAEAVEQEVGGEPAVAVQDEQSPEPQAVATAVEQERRREASQSEAAEPHAAAQPAPSAPAVQPAAESSQDPIAEAPNAVWYVRPPAGGQYGPARGDVMRQWIDEGRVTADSLVWREGWPDWQSANVAIPSLAGAAVEAPAVAPQGPAVVDPGAKKGAARPGRPRRRKSNSLAVAMVVLLSLAAMGLFAALIFVIQS